MFMVAVCAGINNVGLRYHSAIAPALPYLHPSLGSYLLHPCSRNPTYGTVIPSRAPSVFDV